MFTVQFSKMQKTSFDYKHQSWAPRYCPYKIQNQNKTYIFCIWFETNYQKFYQMPTDQTHKILNANEASFSGFFFKQNHKKERNWRPFAESVAICVETLCLCANLICKVESMAICVETSCLCVNLICKVVGAVRH